MENLLTPLLFSNAEAGKFILTHRCGLCLSHLYKTFSDNRLYTVSCPNHGVAYSSTVTDKWTAEEVKLGISAGLIELAGEKEETTVEDKLNKLGF